MKSIETELLEELQQIEESGTSLWLEGKKSNSRDIVKVVCLKDSHQSKCYMRDYVYDGKQLKELRFDAINNF
ncbi:MAG: hypothetical protein K6F37_01495 [Lachnospiraceae bacterium]|nr:hypothetical protein [Lachnospiraceae bacterium]